MAQSLIRNYLHITFSTKHRQPFIQPPYEAELHQYMGGSCNQLECAPVQVGGFADHVHILCLLSKKIALVTLMEHLKASSSKWIKTKNNSLRDFYWQNGYGAFSVNSSEIDKVIVYIQKQQTHHQKVSFQDEYRAFLKSTMLSTTSDMYGIDFLSDNFSIALSELTNKYSSSNVGLYPTLMYVTLPGL